MTALAFVSLVAIGTGSTGVKPASAVTCTDMLPTDDEYTIGFGQTLNVTEPGLLANDAGTNLRVQTSLGPSIDNPDPSDDYSLWGNATIRYGTPGGNTNRLGGFTYTPDPDPNFPFSGIDEFGYWIIDSCGNEDFATAYITVVPTVVDSSYATPLDTPLTVNAANGFLSKDAGVDPTTLDFDPTSAHGGTVDDGGNSDGSFVFTPPTGFSGSDTFGYEVYDLNFDNFYSGTVFIQVGQGAGVPSAPTSVLAVPGNQQATVAWSAANANGSPITSYTVTSSPGGKTKTGSSSPLTVTGLTNGTTYQFTVRATNAIGPGPASAPSNQVTPAPTAPGAPTSVHATASGGQASVSWVAPANHGSPITGYTVVASPGGKTVKVSGTHATVSGLTAGKYTFKVRATNAAGTGPWSSASNAVTITTAQSVARSGYWMLGADGHVYAFGDARRFGDAPGPAVAMATRRDGGGYWTTNASGRVSAFGAARGHGGSPGLRSGERVSTISATPSGNGYWLFTNRGRTFAYGDARSYGDMSGTPLNGPIIASVATPTGRGYYMVGSDGGVFSFGDARFHGSTGGLRLNKPVVGIAPTADNRGYWLVATDGGVFAFDAPFRGSMGAVRLNRPVNGLVQYGNGYLMVASDGGIFAFSNKAFAGSLGANPPASPIIGVAAFATG